ncbi:MAG: MFS transporter [Actinomycetaceae bacterium]|nr:MFS transporter [Actinomycetaceae bacterium]MDY6083155.1 MFS transporter [Actinomycetaceae bacterium]
MDTSAHHTSASNPLLISLEDEKLFKWLAIGVITIVAFEATAVTTALPSISRALNGDDLFALSSGIFMALQLVTIALAGPLSDQKSAIGCFFSGLGIFVLGLTVCTFAASMWFVVVGRGIQGLGGGLIIVPLYTLIGRHVRAIHQPSFFAAFSAAWVVPSLIGPAVTGVIIDQLSWRYIFGLTALLLILALPFLIHVMGKMPHYASGMRSRGLVVHTVLPAAAAGIALTLFQTAANRGRLTMDSGTLIVGSLVITGFCTAAMLPRGTFVVRRGIPAIMVMRGFTNGAYIASEAYLPKMLQDMHGYSPTSAGFGLTVGSVTWAVGAWIQARTTNDRIRSLLPMYGTLTQAIGVVLVVFGAFQWCPAWIILLGWGLAGTGIGLSYPTLAVLALGMTPVEQNGATSSALQLADTVGAAFCLGVFGVFYSYAHVGSIGFLMGNVAMCLLIVLAVLAARRIHPFPDSPEYRRLHATPIDILNEN